MYHESINTQLNTLKIWSCVLCKYMHCELATVQSGPKFTSRWEYSPLYIPRIISRREGCSILRCTCFVKGMPLTISRHRGTYVQRNTPSATPPRTKRPTDHTRRQDEVLSVIVLFPKAYCGWKTHNQDAHSFEYFGSSLDKSQRWWSVTPRPRYL